MQTSMIASRSATDSGFFMAISSTVLISLTLISEGVDDLDVLDVWDSIPDVVETFLAYLDVWC
jgi:hypothetical protein